MTTLNVRDYQKEDGTKVQGHKRRRAQSGERRGVNPAAAVKASAGLTETSPKTTVTSEQLLELWDAYETWPSPAATAWEKAVDEVAQDKYWSEQQTLELLVEDKMKREFGVSVVGDWRSTIYGNPSDEFEWEPEWCKEIRRSSRAAVREIIIQRLMSGTDYVVETDVVEEFEKRLVAGEYSWAENLLEAHMKENVKNGSRMWALEYAQDIVMLERRKQYADGNTNLASEFADKQLFMERIVDDNMKLSTYVDNYKSLEREYEEEQQIQTTYVTELALDTHLEKTDQLAAMTAIRDVDPDWYVSEWRRIRQEMDMLILSDRQRNDPYANDHMIEQRLNELDDKEVGDLIIEYDGTLSLENHILRLL